jgi:hypothetical protein
VLAVAGVSEMAFLSDVGEQTASSGEIEVAVVAYPGSVAGVEHPAAHRSFVFVAENDICFAQIMHHKYSLVLVA